MKTNLNRCYILGLSLLTGALVAHADSQPGTPATTKAKPVAPPVVEAVPPVVLVAGPATITGDNVNVRGKASFNGEVITKLNKGDTVAVIEQVILTKPRAGEPVHWAKIALPSKANVWVHSSYVDASTKTVTPKKLNIRSGPGENYSIVGVIEKGATVKDVNTKGNWIEIETPGSAHAFVAAKYLNQINTATVPTIVNLAPATTEPVPPGPTVATTTTDVPPTVEPTPPTPAPDATTAAAPPDFIEEPIPPRVVTHEGVVKPTVSIQAPTQLALYSKDNGKLINYLYTTSTNLDLRRYRGLNIIVTGEEGLDERWKNTPVLTIQRIQVVE